MKDRIEAILSKQFLGALLIGGTAIGAAMLANPVATAGSGILPSYFVYLLCWLFSAATGCLLLSSAHGCRKTQIFSLWQRHFSAK